MSGQLTMTSSTLSTWLSDAQFPLSPRLLAPLMCVNVWLQRPCFRFRVDCDPTTAHPCFVRVKQSLSVLLLVRLHCVSQQVCSSCCFCVNFSSCRKRPSRASDSHCQRACGGIGSLTAGACLPSVWAPMAFRPKQPCMPRYVVVTFQLACEKVLNRGDGGVCRLSLFNNDA